jgi:hypothetical protein
MDELPIFLLDLKLEKKKEFIESFENAVVSARALDQKKRAGTLPQTRQINKELREFKKVTAKYQKKLRLLQGDTKDTLDAMHINDGFKLGSKAPLHAILNDALETVTTYCQEGDTGKDGDETPELHKLERILAQDFVTCGGEIKVSDSGEFMKLLECFRYQLEIEGFSAGKLSKKYISSIKKRFKGNGSNLIYVHHP